MKKIKQDLAAIGHRKIIRLSALSFSVGLGLGTVLAVLHVYAGL